MTGPRYGVTAKAAELLDYLRARQAKGDTPPKFDEMKDAIHLTSKSGISRLLDQLEERNHIKRLSSRHRSVVVLDAGELATFAPVVEQMLAQIRYLTGLTRDEVIQRGLAAYLRDLTGEKPE